MDTNLALVLLLTPFLGFLINIFFGKALGKTISGIIGTLSIVVSFLVSISFFLQISQTHQAISIQLFDWIQISKFHVSFGFLLDQLSQHSFEDCILQLFELIALLVHLFQLILASNLDDLQ